MIVTKRAEELGSRQRQILADSRRIVVKIGSRLLDESPAGCPARIADQIASTESDYQFAIVSSGAITLGVRALGKDRRPNALADIQAAAAVGQNQLINHWQHGFAAHGLTIGQVLLTHEDLTNRGRFLNARYALRALLQAGVIPVINENDTVATEEIRYGDNDLLAALVANLIGADALIILTDVEGVLDAAPSAGGKRIPLVTHADLDITEAAGQTSADGIGSGGMSSKVDAARAAARHGVQTVVASGRVPLVLREILLGNDIGTLFVPSAAKLSSRKHWIAYKGRPVASIIVDKGAEEALTQRGKSLLAAGVSDVRGEFSMGDAVSLSTIEGVEFGRGLAAYSSVVVRKLAGRRSPDIEETLGHTYKREIVHRDDLVLI